MAALLCTFFVVSHEELQLFHLPGSPYSRTDSEERLPSAEASPQLLQQLDIVILFYFILFFGQKSLFRSLLMLGKKSSQEEQFRDMI